MFPPLRAPHLAEPMHLHPAGRNPETKGRVCSHTVSFQPWLLGARSGASVGPLMLGLRGIKPRREEPVQEQFLALGFVIPVLPHFSLYMDSLASMTT